MNVTILSLISSSLLSSSPCFVGNYISCNNCKFSKMQSLLFYNQLNLHLRNSQFKHALNGIILYNYETITDGLHVTVKNELFQKTYGPNLPGPSSHTFIDCTFINIQGDGAIHTNGAISLYITNCFFSLCTTEKGTIYLQQSRCQTITHNCASQCNGKQESVFLYNDCKEEDFSLFLYNTIIDGERVGTHKDGSVIISRYGSQYYRCNNITNTKSHGFKFDAPYCFSFAMTTIMNCECSCFQMTGNILEKVRNKIVNNVNFFENVDNDSPILHFSVQSEFYLTFESSVILSYTNNLGDENNRVYLSFNDCIINKNFQKDKLTINDNCIKTEYNTDYLTIYPHFTYSNVCRGPILEKNTAAFGCNAGNCIDNNCDRTIGFPDGVVQYSTLIHLDMQTATFSPIDTFTPSTEFSYSEKFSQSFKFSDSKQFSESSKFSQSVQFSKSSDFPQTNQFSKSFYFTKSSSFSETSYFSKTFDFSNSLQFSESTKFSESDMFSYSGYFTESSKFSKTMMFSTSSDFSESVEFSNSNDFSKSMMFSLSKEFTKSFLFSSSSEFSKSHDFSSSDLFDPTPNFHSTDTFDPTDLFTKSSEYSSSIQFSNSEFFSKSSKFTKSLDFSLSSDFSGTKIFNKTDIFSLSNDFSDSKMFSQSQKFSSSEFFKDQKNNKEKTRNTKLPIIIGVSVGILALIAAAIVGVCCFICVPVAVFHDEEEEEEEALDVETIENYRDNPLYNTDLNSTRDPFFSDYDDEFFKNNKHGKNDVLAEDEEDIEYDERFNL